MCEKYEDGPQQGQEGGLELCERNNHHYVSRLAPEDGSHDKAKDFIIVTTIVSAC